ncbi:hypothetical protein SNEBB_005694 [Seison nebaliae]|nr:hypothetical protein SNEBB_005694 [Seison nebaliae]
MIGKEIIWIKQYGSKLACNYCTYQANVGNGMVWVLQVIINITIIRMCYGLGKFEQSSESDNDMRNVYCIFVKLVKSIKGHEVTSYQIVVGSFFVQMFLVTFINLLIPIDVFKRDTYLCFKIKQNYSQAEKYFESFKILIVALIFSLLLATIIALIETRKKSSSVDIVDTHHKWITLQYSAFRCSQSLFSFFLAIVSSLMFFSIWKQTRKALGKNNIIIHSSLISTGVIKGISLLFELIFFNFIYKSPSTNIISTT